MINPGNNMCDKDSKKYDDLHRKQHGGFVPVLKTLQIYLHEGYKQAIS